MHKLNEQNAQFSQCTTSSTPASPSLIEEEQETERYREEKDETESAAAEEETRKEEIVSEFVQVKDDEQLKEKTEDQPEIQKISQTSSGQSDERITVTQDM